MYSSIRQGRLSDCEYILQHFLETAKKTDQPQHLAIAHLALARFFSIVKRPKASDLVSTAVWDESFSSSADKKVNALGKLDPEQTSTEREVTGLHLLPSGTDEAAVEHASHSYRLARAIEPSSAQTQAARLWMGVASAHRSVNT
ncbi:unnamed protein product [Protopolystoma xenopodis]|uniref:Uncharacterized protein n=1 Tax=Protopolystoma xenopodis TaxID=117903 RepID=A0A3S5CCA1_9PLAT|nr:unnamed protein product [Protopolystoma xenopodis]